MKLWLTGVTASKKVPGVTALKRIGLLIPDAPYASFSGAVGTWTLAAIGQATLLLQTDDPDLMEECVAHADYGALKYAQTPDGEFPPDPEPLALSEGLNELDRAEDEPDEDQDYQAAQIAMVMMVGADGNPGTALMLVRSIERITQDERWTKAGAFLLDTFPPPQEWLDATGLAEDG